MRDTPPPKWLSNAVASGLQRIIVLALPGTPAAETITVTAQVWVEAFWDKSINWNQELDEERINGAFRCLAYQIDRFPAPVHVLAAMPDRPIRKALPRKPISESQLKKNKRRIKRLINIFEKK